MKKICGILGLLFVTHSVGADTLSVTLAEYIRQVLTLNEELKTGAFKVQLAEVDTRVKESMSPFMLSTTYNDKQSNQRPTDSRDTGSIDRVSQKTDAFNVQVSKSFVTGTNIGVATGYSFSGTNSFAELAALRKRHTTNVNVNLSQPLLSGVANNLLRRELRISEKDRTISQLEFSNKLETTITRAVETYYTLLQSMNRLSVIRKELDIMAASLRIKEELVAKGFESRDKLLAYRTQMLEKENELLSQQNTVQSQRFAFFELISRIDSNQDLALSSAPMEPFDPNANLALDSLYATARRTRIDYQIAEQNLAKSELTLAMQKSTTLPSLDLNANYYIYGTDANFSKTFRNMGSNDYNSWSMGLAFSSPLGGKSRRDKLLPAQISLQEALYRKTTIERKMQQEVQANFNGLSLCARQFEASQENLTLAITNLAEAQELHTKGFIQLDELSKNQRNREMSEFQLFKAMCDFTIKYFKLKQSVGSLLAEYATPEGSDSQPER
jgi:outer membrane protein TolC